MPFEKKSIENEQQTNDYVVNPVKMTIPKISKKNKIQYFNPTALHVKRSIMVPDKNRAMKFKKTPLDSEIYMPFGSLDLRILLTVLTKSSGPTAEDKF
jgi:hypothetical protein